MAIMLTRIITTVNGITTLITTSNITNLTTVVLTITALSFVAYRVSAWGRTDIGIKS